MSNIESAGHNGRMKKILVTGATGQQGGSVVEALLKTGQSVRALTRNVQSEKARSLKKRGVELVQGDFTNPGNLEKMLADVGGAFLMGTMMESGVEVETQQGIAFVEAAHSVGLSHLVYSSVSDADRKTGVPHFESKFLVEKRIVELGIPHTIIAPVYFHDNMLAPFSLPGLQQGTFAAAISPETKLQGVSVSNIGEFGALALTQRDRFLNKRINIAGDSLTGPELAKTVAEASGRDINFYQVPIDQVRQMSEDMALMYEWFDKVGYSADIEALRRDYPEIQWDLFSDWARRQDWSILDAVDKVNS